MVNGAGVTEQEPASIRKYEVVFAPNHSSLAKPTTRICASGTGAIASGPGQFLISEYLPGWRKLLRSIKRRRCNIDFQWPALAGICERATARRTECSLDTSRRLITARFVAQPAEGVQQKCHPRDCLSADDSPAVDAVTQCRCAWRLGRTVTNRATIAAAGQVRFSFITHAESLIEGGYICPSATRAARVGRVLARMIGE